MNRVKPVMIQTWGVYQQGIYLANPLTIVLCSQLDIPTEAIVMKVTSRKRNEKGFIAESSGWGPALHSATAALCSCGWLTLFTQYNAMWPLQLPIGPHEWGDLEPGHWYFVKKFPQVGGQDPGRLHTSRKVRTKCGWDCVCNGRYLWVFCLK